MNNSNYTNIYVEREDSLATVFVSRTAVRNAVDLETVRELVDIFEALDGDDSVRVIVLTGDGEQAFIGGGDIKQFQGQSGIWFQREFRTATRDLERAIEESTKPVLAAVNGDALGGGTEISMMCDMILATESARFGFPEIGLGIIPNAGGTQRLTHLVGFLKAKELILTGRYIPAAEAEDIGLINEMIPDQKFKSKVDEVAAELAAGPPIAQWFGKRAVNATRPNLDVGLALEASLAGQLYDTSDKEEGMNAFLEKREPSFDGKESD